MTESLQHRVKKLDNAKFHGGKRPMSKVDLIVMHCTAGGSAMSSIDYMNTSAGVSYHYVIDRDGTIYRMLDVQYVGYHAGDSAFPADPSKKTQGGSVNRRSIGISWANRNDGEQITEKQIESALWLCGVFVKRDGISIENVVGHNEVSPGRKSDPGPAINMDTWRAKLAEYLTV